MLSILSGVAGAFVLPLRATVFAARRIGLVAQWVVLVACGYFIYKSREFSVEDVEASSAKDFGWKLYGSGAAIYAVRFHQSFSASGPHLHFSAVLARQ